MRGCARAADVIFNMAFRTRAASRQTSGASRTSRRVRARAAFAAIAVAAVLASCWFVAREQRSVAEAASERTGVAVIGRLIATIEAADVFRAERAAGGDATAAAARVRALLAALRHDDAKLPPRLALGPELDGVAVDWGTVSFESGASEARFSTWIDEVVDAAVTTSDRSGLSFDRDSHLRDLGDAFAIRYPRSADRFARILDASDARRATPATSRRGS